MPVPDQVRDDGSGIQNSFFSSVEAAAPRVTHHPCLTDPVIKTSVSVAVNPDTPLILQNEFVPGSRRKRRSQRPIGNHQGWIGLTGHDASLRQPLPGLLQQEIA